MELDEALSIIREDVRRLQAAGFDVQGEETGSIYIGSPESGDWGYVDPDDLDWEQRKAQREQDREKRAAKQGWQDHPRDYKDVLHGGRKPHVQIPQHYYLDYVKDYGPTTLGTFMAAFDVSETTAQRKLDGLVSQGKLDRIVHKHDRFLNLYCIPPTNTETP